MSISTQSPLPPPAHWGGGPWPSLFTPSCPARPIRLWQAGQLGSRAASKQLLHPTRGGGISWLGEARHADF